MRRLWNLKLVILFTLVAEAAAQNPRVVSVLAKPIEQHLAVSIQIASVFSAKTISTIRSGLPAVIRFEFHLREEPERDVQHLTRSLHILYDLWSERYRLRFNGHEQFVANFAEVEKICSDFEESQLLPLSRLSPHKTYRLRVQVAVIPISAKQDQQLRDWLEASGAAEESAPGEDRASGFRLNLSKLLSFFLGKKDRPFGTSEWAVSPPFRVE